MTLANPMIRFLARAPLVAVVLYVVAFGALVATSVASILDVVERRQALAQTSDLRDQLRGRFGRNVSATSLAARQGSPFLEGPTVTVAGATLLQRLAAAVTTVGGTIQSSQVDLLGARAKDGFVGLVVSCEMEQPALQKLLYDIEAGMPFLFVDQLNVQVPQSTAVSTGEGGRIRVVLGVSGQWQGSR